ERWGQIERLYHAALERSPSARASFLAEASGTDVELRREVESLLDERSGLLDKPLWDGPARAAEHRLSPGVQVGPYRIEQLIGEGGMGEVWKARDTRLNRLVAI